VFEVPHGPIFVHILRTRPPGARGS
jgi:hypothetical protein